MKFHENWTIFLILGVNGLIIRTLLQVCKGWKNLAVYYCLKASIGLILDQVKKDRPSDDACAAIREKGERRFCKKLFEAVKRALEERRDVKKEVLLYRKVRFKFLTKNICLIILSTLFQVCLGQIEQEFPDSYCELSYIRKVLEQVEGGSLHKICGDETLPREEKTCALIARRAMTLQQKEPNKQKNQDDFLDELTIVRFKFLAKDICLIMYIFSGLHL